MHRPARTFVLPEPLSRMLAAYTADMKGRQPEQGSQSSHTSYESDRAPERRDQATHRCRRHLPQRGLDRRLVGAILMEQTEEWTVQRGRYLTLETLTPVCNDAIVSLPAAQRD